MFIRNNKYNEEFWYGKNLYYIRLKVAEIYYFFTLKLIIKLNFYYFDCIRENDCISYNDNIIENKLNFCF